jgi:tetratricopeptide (TPR) repeat protein
MTDDLYERYKEALRVGHVAVLRGSLESALDAYRTAAEIAPSRALPHTSVGGVLLRLGRVDEALVEYAGAVARAPRDEGALLGQAEALATAGMREEAARALDLVSELQAASGRLPESADTLRRAIELSETPERAEQQQEMLRQVRLSEGDQVAEQLLARALRLREAARPATRAADIVPPGAVAPATPETGSAAPDVEPAAEPVAEAEAAVAESVAGAEAEPAPAAGQAESAKPSDTSEAPSLLARLEGWDGWWGEERRALESVGSRSASVDDQLVDAAAPPEAAATEEPRPIEIAGEAQIEPQIEPQEAEVERGEPAAAETAAPAQATEPAEGVETAGAAESEPVGVMEPVAEEAGPQPSGDELLAAAEAADVAGDMDNLRKLLLETARAYGRETRYEAAIDAATRVLASWPSDLDTHLALVELYMARDWAVLAVEKLALLARLADLSGDEEGRQRVCSVASATFPRDDRFESVCS